MSKYVRVRDKETGHHYTVTRARFDASPDLWQELKQPATEPSGDVRPPTYKTTVAEAAAGKKAAKPATSEGES
jgi:hypothetical protein